ncbi:Condensin complex subunit 2 CND2 [Carpediemonas membranifera]|uniref:Condensin complex subunit 2 n=1 Tax=Carpediemonas membranifera TaxID=201153 RepID=A0A8J6E4I2_9EUKA|nr:Condensin complex subunit 2 CND2 [Carpediemonas membranifera]|eukprot:KAG9397223.1 Condensin complex subunit 2 CND2 [Carpediemonas membranifera]
MSNDDSDVLNLNNILNQALKLSSEGKITVKNTWNLSLIEHIDEVLNLDVSNDATDNTFQRASATIDASVKIYSTRVDAIHKETYSLLGGLNINSRATLDEDEDEVKDENGEPTVTRRTRTIRPALEQDPAKLLMDLTVDPNIGEMERQAKLCGDSSAANNLVMARFPILADPVPVLDPRNATIVFAIDEMQIAPGEMAGGSFEFVGSLFSAVEEALYGARQDDSGEVAEQYASLAMDNGPDSDSDDDAGVAPDFDADFGDAEGDWTIGNAVEAALNVASPGGITSMATMVTLPETSTTAWAEVWKNPVKITAAKTKTAGKAAAKASAPTVAWEEAVPLKMMARATKTAAKTHGESNWAPRTASTFNPQRLTKMGFIRRHAVYHGAVARQADQGYGWPGDDDAGMDEVEALINDLDLAPADTDSDSDLEFGLEVPDSFEGGADGVGLGVTAARKQVDLHRLKVSMAAEFDQKPGESAFSGMMMRMPEIHKFSDCDAVSVPIAFVTLLHLCNDRGIMLENSGDDVKIIAPEN